MLSIILSELNNKNVVNKDDVYYFRDNITTEETLVSQVLIDAAELQRQKDNAKIIYNNKWDTINTFKSTLTILKGIDTYNCSPDSLTSIRNKIVDRQSNLNSTFNWYEFWDNAPITFLTSGIALQEVLLEAEATIQVFIDNTMQGA